MWTVVHSWRWRVLTAFGVVAGIAARMAAELAAPDGHEGARVAVGAAPGEDVAIGGLHNGEDVAGALVCHGDSDEGRGRARV